MIDKKFFKVTAYAALFGVIGGLTFEGTNYTWSQLKAASAIESAKVENQNGSKKEAKDQSEKTNATTVSSTKSLQKTETASTTSDGVSGVSDAVLPSIVAIDVTMQETTTDVFGQQSSQTESGSGSGIIVAQDEKYLYIATNNHVVKDATSVSVTFNDKTVSKATVKGTDSDHDLAVVQIALSDLKEKTLNDIKVATLGDSADVKVGQQAIAIGNALGYGTSVTVGYISAKDRTISAEDSSMKLLQTDAAINPGNSGGALVDSTGKVIGINSAKFADESVEGMGFAIPINTALPIVNDIVKQQQVPESEKAYLGIQGTDVTDEYAKYYNMPQGVYVSSVTQGSPAGIAGMQGGDIIVGFDGKEVTSMTGLQEKLSAKKAGETVKVTVKRRISGSYEKETLNVTLGSKKDALSEEKSIG